MSTKAAISPVSAARTFIFQFPTVSFGFIAGPNSWRVPVWPKWRDRRLSDFDGVDWRHGLGTNR